MTPRISTLVRLAGCLALPLAILALGGSQARTEPLAKWIPPQAGAPPATANYPLAVDDEFNTLNWTCFRWKPAGNHTWYTQPTQPGGAGVAAVSCDGVSVKDGVAQITLRNVGGVWTTGRLQMVDPFSEGRSFRRGYFQARIKLPSKTPAGLDVWPAWWVNGRWTKRGTDYAYTEIDILEAWSISHRRADITAHVWPASPPRVELPTHAATSIPSSLIPFDDQWHVWGLRLTDAQACVDIDGASQGCLPTATLVDSPVYPLLSLDVKTAARSTDPAATYTMYVDWVRVYAPPS
jgi:hypothetical protein